MKEIATLLVPGLLVFSCVNPPLQYSESSTEIEIARKANAAYVQGDWDALRAMYADTARLAVNTWTPDQWITADQAIEFWKADRVTFPEVRISDDAVYTMIINDNGEKWVLNWFNMTARHKDGMGFSMPVHIGFRMSGEKFDFVVIMVNNLPAYQAMQPAPSAPPEP